MALEGPTGDFAEESPEAPNAHLTSLPNAKKDMFNVGRRQCLEKRNTDVCVCVCMCVNVCVRVPRNVHVLLHVQKSDKIH